MELKDYCNCDICIALQQMGYNEPSEYTWAHNCRVSDEILVKHPGLSDSGYMDLIDEYGGPYEREEVYHTYIEPIKRFSRNSLIDTDFGEICSCVHLYDAQKWLRKEKEICVEVYACAGGFMWELCKPFRTDSFSGGTTIYVTNDEDNPKLNDCGKFDEWEDALEDGIKVAVKILQEKRENV